MRSTASESPRRVCLVSSAFGSTSYAILPLPPLRTSGRCLFELNEFVQRTTFSCPFRIDSVARFSASCFAPVRDRLKQGAPPRAPCFTSSGRRIDLACSDAGEDGRRMQTVQGTSSAKIVTSHAMFLANVSRHFVSLEIEPMLEAVGRSALCVLGDICVVDRIWGAAPTRILEVRATQDAWMEASADLASRDARRGSSGRRTLANQRSDRRRARSLRRNQLRQNDGHGHSAADLALAQELGDRLAMAIRNARNTRSWSTRWATGSG